MGQKLEEAHLEMTKILEETKANGLQQVESAKKEGFDKAYQQAASFKEKVAKLKELYESDLSQDLMRNALETSQNFVCAELDSSPNALVKFVQEALKTVPEASDIRLRANPNDIKALKDNKELFINLLQRAKDIDIREDKQVSRGILLQTEFGVIDAQLKTQIEEISRLLGL